MANYIDNEQATTLFGAVDTRFDGIEAKIPSGASSSNKMVTASDIASKADLVDGKVPSSQLPSYVDDVLEYASTSQFPATGESGKIYVATDTNKTYRWGGSEYVEISESLALGETSSTAYAGNKGKANADAISDIQDLIPSSATTSNKLATTSDIPDTSGLQPKNLSTTIGSYTTVEGALSGINDGKVDKVTGKGLSTNDYTTADQTALQTTIPLEISQLQASLLTKADVSSVPTELSDLTDDSTHRVVTDTEKTTWSGKQDALTFDNTPTANSNNPVKSGGIKTALDDKMSYADNGVLGAKNLLPYPYLHQSKTDVFGVTWTVDSEGVITANTNGSATTGQSRFYLQDNYPSFLEVGKKYILSDGVTSGAGENSYRCRIALKDDSSVISDVSVYNSEEEFTVPSGTTKLFIEVRIENGVTANVTFKPMIRLASDPDSTWHPYAKTNQELTNSISGFMSFDDNSVLGSHNLLDNIATTTTKENVTYTVNSDKSVSCSNTSSGASTLLVANFDSSVLEVGKEYILSGCPSGGSDSKYYLRIGKKASASDDWGSAVEKDFGAGAKFIVPSNDYGFVVHIGILGGQSTDFTFYPMIRLGTDASDTYKQHSMTNISLTEMLMLKESAATDIVAGATIDTTLGNHLMKQGNMVFFILGLSNVTAQANTTICKIPSGYTPKYSVRLPSPTLNGYIFVDTNGNVSFSIDRSSGYFNVCGSWITP